MSYIHRILLLLLFLMGLNLTGCATNDYDIIIRGGTVYDGSGEPPIQADIGIRSDTIAAIGDLRNARARQIIDASGLAVAPGFINMMSQASSSLLIDGRSQSDIRQGVTLEVLAGEYSMGPLSGAETECAPSLQRRNGLPGGCSPGAGRRNIRRHVDLAMDNPR